MSANLKSWANNRLSYGVNSLAGNGNGVKISTSSGNNSSRFSQIKTTSQIVENILDICSTIVQVLINCGINSCKAHQALDVIMYSFMHFEEVKEHPGRRSKKKIRKTEFINDLINNCEMTRSEAKMTYSITKTAFKAFYEQQLVTKYGANNIDACEWNRAVEQTIDAFMKTGASKSEAEITGQKILSAYQNYLCRLKSKGRYNMHKVGAHYQQERSSTGSNGNSSPCPCNLNGKERSSTFESPLRCEEILKKKPESKLCGQLIGEYCCPVKGSCQDHSGSPLVVKDCQGRVFMMVRGNRIYFNPQILRDEATRATKDFYPSSSSDCLC